MWRELRRLRRQVRRELRWLRRLRVRLLRKCCVRKRLGQRANTRASERDEKKAQEGQDARGAHFCAQPPSREMAGRLRFECEVQPRCLKDL